MSRIPAMPVLLALSVALIVCACFLGSTDMSAHRVVSALTGMGTTTDQIIIWEIRFPRAAAAFVTGAALGISGAALQGLLRNPLAEPGVLGVTSSAALFASASVYFGVAALSELAIPLAAVSGAMGATFLLSLVALRTQSVVTLILVGVGISSFMSAVMALVLNMAPTPFSLSDMINWMLGSVANRSLNDIMLTAPFIVVGAGVLLIARRGLSALTLGEEAAQGLGLNLKHQRLMVVIGAGLATGGAVALAGAIGFVGIVAPHLVRSIWGYDPARILAPSAILSGAILIVADIFVRIAPTTTELKLGVAAALVGAPVFIWIAAQRSVRHG